MARNVGEKDEKRSRKERIDVQKSVNPLDKKLVCSSGRTSWLTAPNREDQGLLVLWQADGSTSVRWIYISRIISQKEVKGEVSRVDDDRLLLAPNVICLFRSSRARNHVPMPRVRESLMRSTVGQQDKDYLNSRVAEGGCRKGITYT